MRTALRQLRLQRRQRRVERRLAGPKVLRAFADAYPTAFFIEIGSNDGEQHDHLRPFILAGGWRGVMVEPVPYVFDRLRRNYGHLDRIALDNVAIADRDGSLTFFHLREAEEGELDRLPGWYDGIGSFSREKVLSHRRQIPDIENRVVATEVACVTFESLCREHGLGEGDIDLLLIDVEGHDAEILRSLDLSRRRPRLIVYEHFHLQREDQAATREMLHNAGYETMEEGFDTWCLQTVNADPLTRTWRRLRPAVPGVFALDETR